MSMIHIRRALGASTGRATRLADGDKKTSTTLSTVRSFSPDFIRRVRVDNKPVNEESLQLEMKDLSEVKKSQHVDPHCGSPSGAAAGNLASQLIMSRLHAKDELRNLSRTSYGKPDVSARTDVRTDRESAGVFDCEDQSSSVYSISSSRRHSGSL